jgi:hypothetical protein
MDLCPGGYTCNSPTDTLANEDPSSPPPGPTDTTGSPLQWSPPVERLLGHTHTHSNSQIGIHSRMTTNNVDVAGKILHGGTGPGCGTKETKQDTVNKTDPCDTSVASTTFS